MIYPILLPKVSLLLKSLLAKSNKNLWRIDGYREGAWFCSGAEILFNICKQVDTDMKDVCIMLPSYFCGQSLKYLRNAGVEFAFYKLNEDFSPDYISIKSLLKTKNVDFFLHVHYFGCVKNQQQTRDLCNQYNISMIEDCAHIFHPLDRDKWLGDYVFFSPHKFFPVLCSSVLFSKKELIVDKLYIENRFLISWYLKGLLKHIYPKRKTSNYNWNVVWSNQSEIPTNTMPNHFDIEFINISRRRIQSISNTRIDNKNKLLQVFEKLDDWYAVSEYKLHNTPYILGFRCHCSDVMAKVRDKLHLLKCPIMMWPDLPYEIKKKSKNYQRDIERVECTIFFFTHEQIDINKYVKLISKAVHGE